MTRSGSLRDLGRLLLGHSSRYRHRGLQEVAARALREPGSGRAWVVSVLNVTLRARRFARSVLRLGPRRLRTKLAYSLTGHQAGAGRRLSLLCPTRSRTGQLTKLLASIARTAAVPGRIEVLCYVDDDDPELAAYRALFERGARRPRRLGELRLLVGPPVGVPEAWNRLAAAAGGGDLLMMANDDQRYVDFGWDAALDARVTELMRDQPDGVLCLYFDAGQYPEGGRDFPILTRRWYDTVGYFTPTMFSQWEVETWVFDIADRISRLYPVPGVFVEHLHYQDYKAPFDATYQRHRMTTEKSFADHALFLRTEGQREADAAKLRAVIHGASPQPPGAYWFAGYLAQQRDLVAAEVGSWLAGAQAVGPPAPGAAGEAAGPGRVLLLSGGTWTAAAGRYFPVLTDVMSAVPEATLPDGSLVELTVVGLGGTQVLAGRPDPSLIQVVWGLQVPEGASVTTENARLACQAGQCLMLPGPARVTAHNGGAQPLVLVGFTVPPGVPVSATRRPGGDDG